MAFSNNNSQHESNNFQRQQQQDDNVTNPVPPHVVVILNSSSGGDETKNNNNNQPSITQHPVFTSLSDQQQQGFGKSVVVSQHNNNNNALQRRGTTTYEAPNPDDVFEFVLTTVHRLVRKRYSQQAVKQKLEQQIQALEILLCNMKNIFEKRRIVAKISKSWGHHSAFTAYADDDKQQQQQQNNNNIKNTSHPSVHNQMVNEEMANNNTNNNNSRRMSMKTGTTNNLTNNKTGGDLDDIVGGGNGFSGASHDGEASVSSSEHQGFVRFDIRSTDGTTPAQDANNNDNHSAGTLERHNSAYKTFNNSNRDGVYQFPEDIQDAEKEIKSALIVLCGRVITRMMHLESATTTPSAVAAHNSKQQPKTPAS